MPDALFIPRSLRTRGGATLTTSLNLSSGDVNFTAGGVDDVVTNSATGTNLVSYGIHYTSQTTGTFLLADMEVGRSVSFNSLADATGTTYIVIPNTTAITFVSSSGGYNARQLSLNGGAGVIIQALTTAIWGVVASRGNVVGSSAT